MYLNVPSYIINKLNVLRKTFMKRLEDNRNKIKSNYANFHYPQYLKIKLQNTRN